jgi:hypothetical protein
MSYPAVPGHRMALDRDGSVGFFKQNDGDYSLITLSQAQMTAMNNETNDDVYEVEAWNVYGAYGALPPGWLGVRFPEARNLVGYYIQMRDSDDGISGLEVSTNTTTGADGSWTTVGDGSFTTSAKPGYRTAIQPLSSNGIRGVRFYIGNSGLSNNRTVSSFHLYGSIVPGSSTDGLRFWDPNSNAEVPGSYFDWGSFPRATGATREFRMKNMHSSLTAYSVSCSIEALTDANPSIVSHHSLSNDGINWGPTAEVGTLGPGVVSSKMYLRRITPADADLSLWTARIKATATYA